MQDISITNLCNKVSFCATNITMLPMHLPALPLVSILIPTSVPTSHPPSYPCDEHILSPYKIKPSHPFWSEQPCPDTDVADVM